MAGASRETQQAMRAVDGGMAGRPGTQRAQVGGTRGAGGGDVDGGDGVSRGTRDCSGCGDGSTLDDGVRAAATSVCRMSERRLR